MIKIGNTIILSNGENIFKGECTTEVVYEAHNIIHISIKEDEIDAITVYKSRKPVKTFKLND